jgi:hypothetical protein
MVRRGLRKGWQHGDRGDERAGPAAAGRPGPGPPGPRAPARHLGDLLVGVLAGTVAYAWMEGGGFLVQRVELVHGGERATGVAYIGYDEESGTPQSHYFSGSGELLEYTDELAGDTLTIWHPAPGSPAFFRGEFSADGTTNAGRWAWPGGGYESTMTRVAR